MNKTHKHKWQLAYCKPPEWLEFVRVMIPAKAAFVCECGAFKHIKDKTR